MNTILILLLENILNQQMQLQFKINRNNGGKLSITILLSMLENILITFLFKLRNRKCKKKQILIQLLISSRREIK